MTRQHFPGYRGAILALLAGLSVASARAETLFSDNFDSDTSAAWDMRVGVFNAGDTDYKVDWSFDYGKQTYNLFADALDTTGQNLTVPPAPNSNGTTKGVKLTVNKDDIGARVVVNLYPKNQNFSGDYVLKFDMFMNHGSWGDIGGGTTENAWFGINHTGAGANWAVFSGNGLSSAFAAPIAGADTSDGLFFTVTCDGGGAKDLWALAGNAGGRPPCCSATPAASLTSTATRSPTTATSRATSRARSRPRPSRPPVSSPSAGSPWRCPRSTTSSP